MKLRFAAVARSIAAIYPPPVRHRWGESLIEEIDAGGPSRWPNAVLGSIGLWLRPAQWPAPTSGHMLRSVVVLALLISAVAGLMARALWPQLVLPPPAGSIETGWVIAVAAGLIVLLPLPRPRPVHLLALARATLPTMAPAAGLAAAVLVAARAPTATLNRDGALILYWSACTSLALTPVIAASRASPVHATIPDRTRTAAGLLLMAVGLISGGVLHTSLGPAPTAPIFGAALFCLGILALLAVHDLRLRRLG